MASSSGPARKLQQRPQSYYDPSYGSNASGLAGGGISHRQSMGPSVNDQGGLSSPSQWKANPSSRHASPSNANVNLNLGIGDENSGNRLIRRDSRRDLKTQDLGGGLPTHNNHGIYDLLPSHSNRPASSSAGLNDSLPYAYSSGSSRDLVDGGQNPMLMFPTTSVPQNPPSAPTQGTSQRNSTLGIHPSYQPSTSYSSHRQPSATSPTSSNSTVHGNNNYDPDQTLPLCSTSNSLYQQQLLNSSVLSRNNSLRNSLPSSGSGSGFHRVDRNLREPAKEVEFRRVRDSTDLRPSLEGAASGNGRRADPMGGYVSVSSLFTSEAEAILKSKSDAFLPSRRRLARRVCTGLPTF